MLPTYTISIDMKPGNNGPNAGTDLLSTDPDIQREYRRAVPVGLG